MKLVNMVLDRVKVHLVLNKASMSKRVVLYQLQEMNALEASSRKSREVVVLQCA